MRVVEKEALSIRDFEIKSQTRKPLAQIHQPVHKPLPRFPHNPQALSFSASFPGKFLLKNLKGQTGEIWAESPVKDH